MLNFGAALAIATNIDNNTNPTVFGVALVAFNLVIVGLVLFLGTLRFHEDRAQWQYRRAFTTQELQVLDEIMGSSSSLGGHHPSTLGERDTEEAGFELSETRVSLVAEVSRHVLKRHLLSPGDVKLIKRVGAGAYGEVFYGEVLGNPAAIKTMLSVSAESVREFRDEIIMTASLRHPNIVSFVGAAWGGDLIGMCLEWLSRGSCEALLENTSLALTWEEPLLKLATDLSRSLVYLSTREYFDEREGKVKVGIVHRDIKPANLLISDYMTAKLSDFGTSKAKGAVTNTMVGTPMFAAPEIMRGEKHNQAVDVYSFGLTLVNFAVDGDLSTFVGERWRVDYKKDAIPNTKTIAYNAVLRSMWEEGWRPVTHQNPISWAPQSINRLLMACMAHEPSMRPTWEEVLRALTKDAVDELEEGSFGRQSVNASQIMFRIRDQVTDQDLSGFISNPMRDSRVRGSSSALEARRPTTEVARVMAEESAAAPSVYRTTISEAVSV